MIYKRLPMLILFASLGACSNMPTFMGGANKTAQNAQAQKEQIGLDEDQAKIDATPANILLAQSLFSQPDLYQISRRTISDAVKAKMTNVYAQFTRGDLAQSDTAMKHVIATELNLTSGVYVLAGDIALANSKPEEAIEHYKKALRLNEHNAKAANRMGVQLRAVGKFKEAEQYYSQAINSQPSSGHSYRNRAVLNDLYLNKKVKALEDYNTYAALLEYQLYIQEQGAQIKVLPTSTSTNDAVIKALAPANQQLSAVNVSSVKDGVQAQALDSGEVVPLSVKQLSEAQLKVMKGELKLAKRWIADVGRQVKTLQRAQSSEVAGGQ